MTTAPSHDMPNNKSKILVLVRRNRPSRQGRYPASMGTLQNGIESVFRVVVKAARGLENVQFVVALGNKLDPEVFDPVPENVVVVRCSPETAEGLRDGRSSPLLRSQAAPAQEIL
jgi:UDP:flavonoid glycosyltransferase YjiC (YdhE family)